MQTNVPETQGVIFFQQIQNKKLTAFRWKGTTKQRKTILFEGLLKLRLQHELRIEVFSLIACLPCHRKFASLIKNNADAARVPSMLVNAAEVLLLRN